jgi:hypothetical protein
VIAMPAWLEDNGAILLGLLALAALFLFVAWWRRRKQGLLVGAVVLAALVALGALYLFVLAGETDRQQIARKINEMSAAVKAGNPDGVFQHIAKDFRYKSTDRSAFRKRVEDHMKARTVTEVVAWDIGPVTVNRTQRTATANFMVRGKGTLGDSAPHACEATFVLEPDNQWRMVGFKLFNSFVNANQEINVPGL